MSKKKEKTLGELVEELRKLKDTKEEINKQLKDLEAEISQVEYEVIGKLEVEGTDKISTSCGTASLKVENYPQIEDMDSFFNWCADNGRSDMFQRRIAVTAFKEYFEETNELPDGIKTYTKKSINFRRR